MNKKYHYVYKTTCLINDKFYIGIHSTNEINDNYLGSGKILKLSIRKHGKNNHKKEILEYCDNRKLVFAREKDIVNEKLLNNKLCMNLVVGGCGCALGWANFNKNTSKEKMFDICSKGGKKGGFVNRHLWSDETKSRCKKISSDILKKAHVDGKMRYDGMLDKKHSNQTKEQMSISSLGEKNSQFGTCWIFSLEMKINKKIKKEELEIFIQNGWIKGRKTF